MSKTKILAALAALPLVAALAACSSADADTESDKGSADNPVKIGVVGASDPYWDDYVDAAADEGISVDIVDFSDYAQPNPALANGDIDMNQFQHIIYLAQFNEAQGQDLTPIGATVTYPLGLYSSKYDSVEDIPAGATVAVPNDESNQARGLLVLQSAGLITLKDGGTPFSTTTDVVEDSSKVTVKALEANLTPTSLPDVAAAIINNDFIEDADLDPSEAIATDDPSDETAKPYINIFVTRADDADNPVYNKLVKIYHDSEKVIDGVKEVSGGTAVVADNSPDDLKKTLKTVVSQIGEQS